MTDKPPQGRFSGLRIGFSTANGLEPYCGQRISDRSHSGGVGFPSWTTT